MNKLLSIAVVAGGLLLLDAPEAAAHTEVRVKQVAPAYYHDNYRSDRKRRNTHSREYYERNRYAQNYTEKRAHSMPKWLKRKKSFRRWYQHSPLRSYRFLTWNQLFDLYNWERSYYRAYRY